MLAPTNSWPAQICGAWAEPFGRTESYSWSMHEIQDALGTVGVWIAAIAAIIGAVVIGAAIGGWVVALILAVVVGGFLGWAASS